MFNPNPGLVQASMPYVEQQTKSDMTHDTTVRARGRRSRFNWLATIVAATLLLAALGAAAFLGFGESTIGTTPRSAEDDPRTDPEPRPPDMQGTYLLDDGEVLTLYGGPESKQYELESTWVGLAAEGDDRFIALDDPDEVLTIERGRGGEVEGLVLERPDKTVRHGVPTLLFEQEEVAFTSGGAQLAGSLLIPSEPGPHPAVVIVHGAEYGTREVYRLIGSHFARRGVAALIYDKRGTGESTGSFAEATFDDLVGDALAGVRLLSDHAAIDSARVGLMGFSQGGWIIAMAAEQNEDVDFLVPVSPSGSTAATAASWLSGNLLHLRGLDEHSIDVARRGWAMMYSTLSLVDAGLMPSIPDVPGFWFHSLDPHLSAFDLWSKVQQPVLGIWGELDCQVPALDSVSLFEDALRSGGNTHYSLRVLAGASHGIALVPPCAHELGGMHTHGARYQYGPGFLTAPAEWILAGSDADAEILLPDATPSSLAWHQSPDTDIAWYGTFLSQVTSFIVLVLGFGIVGCGWVWGHTFWRRRKGQQRESLTWNLAGLGAIAGLAATLLGSVAMAELLLLGDVHADFLVGGPLVEGRSPLLMAATAAAWTTVVITAVLAGMTVREWTRERSTATREGASRLTLLFLPTAVLFIGSALYWGLLSTRLIS